MRGVLRAGVDVRTALKVAPAADARVHHGHGDHRQRGHAGRSRLANWVFWASLAFALAVAFVLTVPINRWLISRGKGPRRRVPVPHSR
jgi:Domain of unknown function (DUF4396)